eukprot:Skav226990  [mRNA]  locus=scaffold2341:256338:262952:+ [translate_table: standard]
MRALLLVLHFAVVLAAECPEGEATGLLQDSRPKRKPIAPPDRSGSALKELSERLLTAKQECLKSSVDCLPSLRQVRYRVWPYIQELLHLRQKAWEPQDFHPQVLRTTMNCMGDSNYTVFLLHVWKAAGWAVRDNLVSVGHNSVEVPSLQADNRWCEKLKYDSVDPMRRSTFTFVREPLSRLISGYAEIERTYRGPRFFFLKKAQEGTSARARLFMDKYFEDGANYNGHVTHQSDYFAPFSSKCSLPIDFVGKTERIAEDWQRYMESLRCEASKKAFSNALGQHPTKRLHKEALTKLLNVSSPVSLLSVGTSVKAAMAQSHIKKILKANGASYLKAFCWLHLIDYVMFDYDLPETCNQVEMQYVMNLTKVTSFLGA